MAHRSPRVTHQQKFTSRASPICQLRDCNNTQEHSDRSLSKCFVKNDWLPMPQINRIAAFACHRIHPPASEITRESTAIIGHSVNGVDVFRIEWMILILAHRQFMRLPVGLTRSGKNDPNSRVLAPDRFHSYRQGMQSTTKGCCPSDLPFTMPMRP